MSIKFKDTTLAGNIGTATRSLTLAEYNALSASEKAKDILYIITDDEASDNFQPIINANGILQGNGAGNITAKTLDTLSLTNDNDHVPTSATVKSAIINQNLLDNAYFVGGGSQQGGGQFPINQRGLTSYPSTGYNIDRWISQTEGTLEITSEGVNFGKVISAYNYNLTKQQITNMSAYVGREFTLSFLTPTGLYTGTGTLSTSYVYVTVGTNPNYMRFIYSSVTNSIYVEIVSLTNFLVQAVKLELGDTQTLAHQENGAWVLNEIPNYEEQLIRCKSSTADSSDTYANDTVAFKSALPKIVTFTKTTDVDGYADFLSVTRSHCTILSVATDYSSGSVLFGDVGVYRSADYWTIWFHFKDGTSLANTSLNITLCIVEY